MDWSDPPAVPARPQPSPFAPASPSPTSPSQPSYSPEPAGGPIDRSDRSLLGSARRTMATALLAVGLLTVGGAAVVFAADPGASAAPNATTQPSTGTGSGAAPGTTTRPSHGSGSHNAADCPNMGSNGGGGGSTTPSTPTTPTPATPSTPTTPSATPEL